MSQVEWVTKLYKAVIACSIISQKGQIQQVTRTRKDSRVQIGGTKRKIGEYLEHERKKKWRIKFHS